MEPFVSGKLKNTFNCTVCECSRLGEKIHRANITVVQSNIYNTIKVVNQFSIHLISPEHALISDPEK